MVREGFLRSSRHSQGWRRLDHGRSLADSSQFLIYHSFYHSTLYSARYWQRRQINHKKKCEIEEGFKRCTGNIRQQASKLKAHNRWWLQRQQFPWVTFVLVYQPHTTCCHSDNENGRFNFDSVRRLYSATLRGRLNFVLNYATNIRVYCKSTLTAKQPYQKCSSPRVRKNLAVHVAGNTAVCSEVLGSKRASQTTIETYLVFYACPSYCRHLNEIF